MASSPLAQVLLALAAMILVGRLLGALLRYANQPPVIGEVLAGIALGPSVLGALFHGWSASGESPLLPAAIQPLTYLVPLRYFIVIVRGIFLKGVGVAVLWPHILALGAWGLAILMLAVARSRKTLS